MGVSLEAWRVPPPGLDLSAGVHPGRSLLHFLGATVVPKTLLLSARVMIPFYAFWSALSFAQSRDAAKTLRHNAGGLARSMTFQTGFVTTMWAGLHKSCVFPSLLGRSLGPVTLLVSRYYTRGALTMRQCAGLSWLGGLWVQVERMPRRVELAAFFWAHACLILFRRSGLPSNDKAAALLLAAGVAPMVAHWTTGDKASQNRFVRAVFCE